MLQPVNLQLAHFNIEHSAQISKDAMAAAQQTGQTQDTVQENVRRAQRVEASIAAAEAQKIKRRDEDDKNKERRRDQQQTYSRRNGDENNAEADNTETAVGADKPVRSFEFYA